MKLNFNIDYHTNWGESIYIIGSIPELGGGSEADAIKMSFVSNNQWSFSLVLPDDTDMFTYCYIVKCDNGYVRREWGIAHQFHIIDGIREYNLCDKWQDMPDNKPLYSSAFTQCIFRRDLHKPTMPASGGNVLLKVQAPMIRRDQVLAIIGSIPELGSWDTKKAIELDDSNFPEWSVSIDLSNVKKTFEYKFLIIGKETRKVIAWEARSNRKFTHCPIAHDTLTIESGMRIANPLPNWKGAGTAIPVFSLRSDDDFGVGDFYDLKRMVDWAAKTGQRILQILPVNDTTMTRTWTDSYPYNANSTFALHPMYIRPSAIGKLSNKTKLNEYKAIAKELNALEQVDYERVNAAKNAYTTDLYKEFGAKTIKSADYKEFVEKNEYWLKPYAAFCVLRDINGTPDFSKWGIYSTYETALINKFCEQKEDNVNFIYFVQYHLDKQLKETRNYAHSKGVVLKGDIPIGISRTSVDAWVSPQLFNLNSQAGAPPDDFSILGQNWGFPTYNWEKMSEDGFQWWKNRFRKMSEYFDAYRIDHILGFFRIWQIPMDAVHGLLGTFNPALPFSADELKNSYDFWLDKDFHTTPYIMDDFIADIFGEYANEARKAFLCHKGNGRYGLNEAVNTQRKIEEYFCEVDKDGKNGKVKEALLRLIDNVLFIEDGEQPNMYHPRISAQSSYIYQSLSDYEKWCFDRLYNDFFYHRHNDFWYGKAMWKLPPLINTTDMLVCGEDLGMIPDCIPSVMKLLQILSLEIQRMPKNPMMEFGDTYNYPYQSVCTTSTHDMPGIRGWWEEDSAKAQRFFNNVLREEGTAPNVAEPWICDRIVTMHLESPAMLTILPLQDWLSVDGVLRRKDPKAEQINIPAVSRHYWRYRMHITLERLNSSDVFNNYIKDKIHKSGR